ncbi:hypothetical protein PAECIP111892_01579 [Paenibacillus auburnensis]|jgi:23S rRNA (pseudouridine1915-N3)-methyltransferase|uniref:DUF2487 family protein n=1 Tax=Paenibacillus auburnensis TaxID=2905649 RepID=A0ABN8FX68_9BACL|nr:DUF2487 family protein [Paenibacillus auburnensis]CAH1194324.1 hypothetical protein PAECIP111892_01579 [Paenibacillus auburnensis]
MKFSSFTAESWEENHKYYDTCLLPFTGLHGGESPSEAAAILEQLRDLLELIEQPFQGRIVTYPAVQYATEHSVATLNDVCRKVKSNQFQFVIVASAAAELSSGELYESDLVLSLSGFESSQKGLVKSEISDKIQAMWQRGK